MIPLSLRCHFCDRTFPSGVCLERRGARGLLIEGIVYECPHCVGRDPYLSAEQQPRITESSRVVRPSRWGWKARRATRGSRLAGRAYGGVTIGVLAVATGVIHVVHGDLLSIGF
jgi:hypothetical protein